MGNSYSTNNEKVVKALRGKINGIPIWPPIKKLALLDIVVIQKDGSVTSLDLKADHLQDIKESNKIHELRNNYITTRDEISYKLSHSTDQDGEARLSLLQSFAVNNVGIALKNNKNLSITIENKTITNFFCEDKDVIVELADILTGAKIHNLYGRHNKSIFVITEMTNTKGFSVKYLNDTGAHFKVLNDNNGFKIEHNNEACFETSDTVTIAIKALKFDISSDGKLQNVMYNNRGDQNIINYLEDKVVEVPAANGKRIALLIGNNKYQYITGLTGCSNDVDNFEKYLKNIGFETDPHKDLDYDSILEKMNEYVSNNSLGEGDLFVFYYAGHGGVRRADNGNKFASYEETICPIDTSNNGINCDISRDMIQVWISILQSKGVKVLLFFDSCHSGGIIRGEDIPDGSRTHISDNRPISEQNRPPIPAYNWLSKVQNSEDIEGVSKNVAWLAACKSYEFASETPDGGYLTIELLRLLKRNEKKASMLSFQDILESITNELQTKGITQHPDITGNTDTVAFCVQHLMKQAPNPYILISTNVEESKGSNEKYSVQFLSPSIFPFVTNGSKFLLFESDDSNMKSALATLTVKNSKNILLDNKANVSISDETVFLKAKLFRAIEIHHEIGDDRKHYIKVGIESSSIDSLKKLKEILHDLKHEMYSKRNNFPIKVLPPTCLIIMNDSDPDIKISHENDYLTVRNNVGHLVCPKILFKSCYDLNLIASYIASYAHWNMVHKISNPTASIDENKVKIIIKDESDRELNLNNSGEYELNWNYNKEESQPFRICVDMNCDDSYALMLVELDINYGVYYHEDYNKVVEAGHGMYNLKKPGKKFFTLPIEPIVKENGGKWCNPLFEWRLFVSNVRDERQKSIDTAFSYLNSEGIQEPDFTIVDTHYDRKARETIDHTEDWISIPIKFRVSELSKYSRSSE